MHIVQSPHFRAWVCHPIAFSLSFTFKYLHHFFIWHLHFYLDLLTHAHLLLWVIINKIIWTFSWNWITIVWSISLFFVWHENCMYKNWVASAKQNITVIHTTWKRNGEKYYCFIDLVVDKKYWFKKMKKIVWLSIPWSKC